MTITANFQKLVTFDTAERGDIAWLVEHGFGKNATDAVRKSVVLARRVKEARG